MRLTGPGAGGYMMVATPESSGRPTLIDEEHVYATVRTSVDRMVKRVGLRPGTTWPTTE